MGSDGKSSLNQAFTEWFGRGQTLLSWINSTLLDSPLPYIVGKETTKDTWESLERCYGSSSPFHVIELKKHIWHMKKGTSSMLEYLHQVMFVADQLVTCNAPIGEEDLILYTFSGLPSIYRLFQTSIHTTAHTFNHPPPLPPNHPLHPLIE